MKNHSQSPHIECSLQQATRRRCLFFRAETQSSGARRAVCTQNLLAGQVILSNAPLMLVAHDAKQHCSNCFQTPPTKRCSACRQVWYCTRQCQVQDFPLHRMECQGDLPTDARLLIRTFVKLCQTNHQDASCQLATSTGSGVHICSRHHFFQLQPSMPLDHHEMEIVSMAKTCLQRQSKRLIEWGITSNNKTNDDDDDDELSLELKAILCRFRSNNFGIVDSMVRVIASGIYPLGALLNHSCAPNCLLRYTKTGVLQVVAARDIPEGEELTHSYVELVAPTPTRQLRLKQHYGFDCNCVRCQSSSSSATAQVSFPSEYGQWEVCDLVHWILEYYNPTTSIKDTTTIQPLVQISLDDLLRPSSANAMAIRQEVTRLQNEANLAMANDDVETELQCLSEAVDALLATSSPKCCWCSSMELYQVLCQRLSTWIVVQETNRAIHDCEHIIALLCLALFQTPNHPLLGLQLFTLGDLYDLMGQRERAINVYQWALHTLTISHGPESEMVQLLQEKLR